jgi:asparagine synthase (glutamine-hydrolysing)
LDHRVVELACSIPFSLKVKAGTTKYILKEAMKGFLPPRILKQRKQGFAIPLRRWFFHELSDFARKLLLDSSGWSRHFFRTSYVRWLLEEHRSGRQNFGTQIYALVIFELWNRLAKETKGKIASQAFALKDLAE